MDGASPAAWQLRGRGRDREDTAPPAGGKGHNHASEARPASATEEQEPGVVTVSQWETATRAASVSTLSLFSQERVSKPLPDTW